MKKQWRVIMLQWIRKLKKLQSFVIFKSLNVSILLINSCRVCKIVFNKIFWNNLKPNRSNLIIFIFVVDDQNSNKSILNVSESDVTTVKMIENATESHSVMPEGLQPNVNIDEQVFNTSSVKDNLIQNEMSDKFQGLYKILRFFIILVL